MLLVFGASAQTKKPNIIYILADDLGWTDVACYGSKYYETPNIDRLASEGMRFTSGYAAAPNCQPSRAALLSGQYEPRTGVYTVGNINRFAWQTRPLKPVDNVTQLPLDKITIPNALKTNGYATAMFGKWHLGNDADHLPDKRGFDEFIESSGRHFDFDTTPKTEYPKGTYLADFLTDRSVDFIRKHKDEPFFLYLPHFGVHAPHEAKKELIEKFKKKQGVGGHNNPAYAAMIYSIDESVGRIMKTLDELGIADNTLVIFTSDNGGVGGYQREGIKKYGGNVTDNAPLRGGKGMLYEGGVREPFIFRFPGKIKAGTTSDEPIINIDMYPTFLELTGTKKPENYTLDGVSILSVLTSNGEAKLGRDALYWHFPGYLGAGEGEWRTTPAGAIRSGDWKLIEFFEDGRLELYNLKDDLSQQHDLSKEKPDLTKELHEKLVAWRKETGAKMPTKNENVLKEAPAKKGGKKKKANSEDE
jgi:arylsulfatase A-like enzyme